MRTGISITLKPADRRRLKVLARDRNAPHKHVWRAEIVLLSADGIGTNEITWLDTDARGIPFSVSPRHLSRMGRS
jgi:hypothetical protein